MALDFLFDKDHAVATCDGCRTEKVFSSDMSLAKRQMNRKGWRLVEKPATQYSTFCKPCLTNQKKERNAQIQYRPELDRKEKRR